MSATHPTTQKAIKRHSCSWCGESINAGDTYERWRWFDGADAATVKMHPECSEAESKLCQKEGGYLEWEQGEYSRGCWCENGDCHCGKEAE